MWMQAQARRSKKSLYFKLICMYIIYVHSNYLSNNNDAKTQYFCSCNDAVVWRIPETSLRSFWLALALAPYVSIAAIDAWMHERGREVPRHEQWVHAGLAITLTVFLAAVFVERVSVAMVGLAAFIAMLCIDEFGFHRGIAASERRIHLASWCALAGFVIVWRLIDG